MSDAKLTLTLPKPMPASNDCLPHAAMNLGSARGVGMRPRPGMVSRLVIQPQLDAWCFFRMDDAGGFVGESWHPSKEDALHTARREFGQALIDQILDELNAPSASATGCDCSRVPGR